MEQLKVDTCFYQISELIEYVYIHINLTTLEISQITKKHTTYLEFHFRPVHRDYFVLKRQDISIEIGPRT